MIDPVFKAIYATREMIWKKCSEALDGLSAFCRMSARPMRLAFVLALALGAATTRGDSSPGSAPTVTVTKFHQSYPHSGKATIEYTVGGTLPNNAVVEIVLDTGDASATFVQSGVVTGANSNVIDFASSFGGALVLTNASFTVSITAALGGVQLWENGPYWADCNVGASTPDGYGYYFWWGDTVGYVPEIRGADSYYNNVRYKTSTGTIVSESPFTEEACPIWQMDDAALIAGGWIDSTGNLAAEHDAATAHLGSPWRMPTLAEFVALTNFCTSTWTTFSNVWGLRVTGKGAYSDKNIFLPVAGYGLGSEFFKRDSFGEGNYWSSTPDGSGWEAYQLSIKSGEFEPVEYDRYFGYSVRPVRGAVICGADGIVTYDPSETQTTPTPVPKAWLDGHPALLAGQSGGYEAAANATASNGRKVWECYATGVDPSDPLDDFRITRFWMDGDMPMFEFNHTTNGNGNSILPCIKPLGKKKLTDTWLQVPDGGIPSFRFFAAEVVPPGCESAFKEIGGVQLWKNGPYWSECNLGATSPDQSGYYFWWGDTVGYTNTGSAWISVKDGSSFRFVDNGTAATYGKDEEALRSAGYIDSTGYLAETYDAATACLGSPWRMPTYAEFLALKDNCNSTWTTRNGVSGRLFTGKGEYADRSIFLPVSGCVSYGNFRDSDQGFFWSSKPAFDEPGWVDNSTYSFDIASGYMCAYIASRYEGLPVRPVRDAGLVSSVRAAAFVNIAVRIIWYDNSDWDGNRPESVTVRLYADGVEVDSHVLTAAESWQFTFVEKPRYQEDGKTEIAYTVGEDAVAMYAATVSGYTIGNNYRPGVTSVSVSKVWNDNNDANGRRPDSIMMSLSDWKRAVTIVILNEDNGWTATVNNLPTIVNGAPAQYAWEEQQVYGYTLEKVEQQGNRMIFTNILSGLPVEPTAGRRPRTRGSTWYVFDDSDEPL